MKASKPVIIHQALHGYSDGHSLLACSCQLNPAEERVLHELSDLSGSFTGNGFDPYLTGYPIPNSKLYAIGRTWHAHEMKRPGCVWTHTLLIDFVTLSHVGNLSFANKLFSRPDKDSYVDYNKPLETKYPKQDKSHLLNRPGSDHLIFFLYEENNKSIVIPTKNRLIQEGDTFNLWSQQWPRLRRTFTFCTGAFSPRYLGNKVFDLQIANGGFNNQFLNQKSKEDILLVPDSSLDLSRKEWFNLYKKTDLQDLWDFMFNYGSDVKGSRKNYIPLFLAYQLLKGNDLLEVQLTNIINFFEQYFPEKEEARSLKKDVLLRLFKIDTKQQYYFMLCLADEQQNFNSLSAIHWNYFEMIQSLWESKTISKLELSAILKKTNQDYFGEKVPDLLSVIPPEVWIKNKWITTRIIKQILKIHPHILGNDVIWISSQSIQTNWFKSAFSTKAAMRDGKVLKEVVHSMLNQKNEFFADELNQLFAEKLIQHCVSFIKKNNGKSLPPKWEDILLQYPMETIMALKNAPMNENGLHIILKSISNSSLDLKHIDANIWVEIIRNTETLSDGSKKFELFSCVLASCFSNHLKDSAFVCSHIFQKVHDEAEIGNIEDQSWDSILSVIPRISTIRPQSATLLSKLFGFNDDYVPSWDRCEILRRSIVECYIAFDWNLSYFFQSVSRIDTFKRIIKFCSKSKIGKTFIKDLKKSADPNKYKDHIKIINSFTSK